MRKITLFAIRALALLVVVATGVILLNAFVGVGLVTGVLLASGAAAAEVVNPDPVTTQKQKEKSPELLVDTVSKKITEMKPSLHPLDTILRHIGRGQNSPSWKYGYYAVDVRSIRDHVAGTDPIVIDALGASVEDNKAFAVPVANMHVWQVDDNVLFQTVLGDDELPLVANIVNKKMSDGQLEVMFVNRKPTQFTIPAATKLTRIGNSKSELDAQTSPYAVLPQKDFNYCQIHMAQVQESVYAALHDKEVAWDIADYQAQSLYDMRRSMELTSLIGARRVLVDPIDGQQKYFSGGLMRFIDKKLDIPGGGITNATFVDWTKAIFTGNSGADKRFLFAGNELISELSKVDTIQKQIDAKLTEVVYGITFNRIETNFGVLLVKHHQLMTELGLNMQGMVLDMNNVERATFKKMEARKLMLKESGQSNADAFVVDETFCLALLYPDTHALIGPA